MESHAVLRRLRGRRRRRRGARGIPAFIETVGALVMGSKTYEFIREHRSWSYGDRPSWVLARRELEPMDAATGLRFASQYVAAGLLDRVRVTVVTIALGTGLPLFAEPLLAPMRLLGATPFAEGMIELSHQVMR